MSILDKTSLAATLDAFEDIDFYGNHLNSKEAEEVALWICGSEGKDWSYRGLPAPTPCDIQNGIRLYTGEQITTRAGIGHILGEEAIRALIKLAPTNESVKSAIDTSTKIVTSFSSGGYYCCGRCSSALLRHLSVSPIVDTERRLADGMRILREHRDGNGRWKVYPFYYTLLALTDIPEDLARDEMQYVAPTCERTLKRVSTADKYGMRRRDVLERILERC